MTFSPTLRHLFVSYLEQIRLLIDIVDVGDAHALEPILKTRVVNNTIRAFLVFLVGYYAYYSFTPLQLGNGRRQIKRGVP